MSGFTRETKTFALVERRGAHRVLYRMRARPPEALEGRRHALPAVAERAFDLCCGVRLW